MVDRWFLISPLLWTPPPPLILFTPLFFKFYSTPLPHPALSVTLFLGLNVSSCHICVVLLNDIIDQNLLGLGTLVLAAPCCVFYATWHPIYRRFDTKDMVFTITLIWYHTHTCTDKHMQDTQRPVDSYAHINIY